MKNQIFGRCAPNATLEEAIAMTPEQRLQLLAALIKDRDQTRAALDFITQQKQHEETLYWETGIMRETTRTEDLQNSHYLKTLFTQHEQTVKAYYDAIDPQ